MVIKLNPLRNSDFNVPRNSLVLIFNRHIIHHAYHFGTAASNISIEIYVCFETNDGSMNLDYGKMQKEFLCTNSTRVYTGPISIWF